MAPNQRPSRIARRRVAPLAVAITLLGAGGAAAITITGTPRADTLGGSARADLLRGLGGSDLIRAGGGDDRMLGLAGNDRLFGQEGADTILGGTGDDRLSGGAGDDRLSGEAGDDRLSGDAGRDRLTGGAGDDVLVGGPQRDTYLGGPGNDTVNARDGVAEVVDCGAGDDLATVDALDTTRGCERVRGGSGGQVAGDFDSRVRALADISQPQEAAPLKIADVQPPTAEGDYVCSVARYRAAPGYDDLFFMDPTTDVIYPGSIIYGDTITTGEYIPLIADRAPLTLSTSLENIAGNPARTVDAPSLSTVRGAINSILAGGVTGATPARIAYTIEEVHSQDQLALSLGGNYKDTSTKVKGSFDFSRTDVSSRVVAKFQQIYYTIDTDLPATPGALFRTPPSLTALGTSSPMYVSSVTYGRMVLFTAESRYSRSEIAAALEASFRAAGVQGGASIGARDERILANSTVKAYVLGGSGGVGAEFVVQDVDGIAAIIREGGDYSKDSPGAPLSYKLRYVKNNAVAKIVLASEYNVRQCDRVKFNYNVALKRIYWDDDGGEAGGTAEAFGDLYVSVAGPAGEISRTTLWNRPESNPVGVPVGPGGWPSVGVIASARLTVDRTPDRFVVGGTLSEDDFGAPFDPDDHLGAATANVFRGLIDSRTTEPTFVNFNGAGNAARVEFEITPAD